MTQPQTVHTSDATVDDDEELSRVSVLVGGVLIDVGLPAGVSVSALVSDVIELADDRLRARSEAPVRFENAEGRWTFARVGGSPIPPEHSLADAGVHDGDVLIVRQAAAPASPVLIDELTNADTDEARATTVCGEASNDTLRLAVCFALSAAFAVVAVFLCPVVESTFMPPGFPVAAILLLGVGGAAFGAAALSPFWSSDARVSAGLTGISLPLIFGGVMGIFLDAPGIVGVSTALAVTATAALLHLLICGTGRAAFTAVITLALFGIPAATVQVLLDPNPRAVGAVLATVAVIVVYQAPRASIVLSGLPVPRVPTAGEPLDDIETEGGTAVEGVQAVGKQIIPTEQGMSVRVRRARARLTGIVSAAAVLAATGCYFAVDISNGFFWQGTAFTVTVAVVLCLRGRTHHDLVQSAVLIGGGLSIALMVIVKTAVAVEGFQIVAAALLVVLAVLVALCGFVAPGVEFSPVMRRWAELGEYAGVVLIFPLACWIIRVYAFVRELRL